MANKIDKNILDVLKKYLQILNENDVQYESAYLFGSYAHNQFNEDSDIDIAIIVKHIKMKFFKELELLKYRRNIDLRIEPHIVTKKELNTPFGEEILTKGIKIA